MKVKILIGVICFVVGAGAYYLYENNFSHSSKVEKCADKKYYDFNYTLMKEFFDTYKDVPGFLKRSYVDKVRNNEEYRNNAEYCEDYSKKYPDIFKKQY